MHKPTTRGAAATLVPALCLGILAAAGCDDPRQARSGKIESRHQHFRTTWWGVDHNDLTEDSLGMLSSFMREVIGDANEDTDSGTTKLLSEYHFDNCRFAESFDTIRSNYSQLLVALDPQNYSHSNSVRLFGRILHTTQDFFAHSNWVEHRQTDLLNPRGFLPPAVPPGSKVGNLLTLQHGIPGHWAVASPPAGSVFPQTPKAEARVRVVWDGASWQPGLYSGTYADNKDDSVCHVHASIPHGDHLEQGPPDTYLAKDDPDSFMHDDAVRIAKRQTTEELCRLERMVLLRYGQPGGDHFRRVWSVDNAKLRTACPDNQGIVAGVITAIL